MSECDLSYLISSMYYGREIMKVIVAMSMVMMMHDYYYDDAYVSSILLLYRSAVRKGLVWWRTVIVPSVRYSLLYW